MKRVISGVAVALVAFIVFVVARDRIDIDLGSLSQDRTPTATAGVGKNGGNNNGNGGNNGNGKGTNGNNGNNNSNNNSNGTKGGGTHSPSPQVTEEKPGVVQADIRGTKGTERVSCSAIETEFRVSADQGKVRWSLHIRDAAPGARAPYPGNTPPGIVADATSGTLENGQSRIVRLRGRFDGPGRAFFVVVDAPTASGSSGVTFKFSCV